MGERGGFDGRTILLMGAGCAAGAILARDFARQGGQVVLIDYDEAAMVRIARHDPARISALRLNYLEMRELQRFSQIWQEEPVHVLVHLQALRLRMRPGLAMSSILEVSDKLQPALQAGNGRVLLVFEAVSAAAPLGLRAFESGMQGLARLLDEAQGNSGIRTNGLEVQGRCTRHSQRRFSRLALSLTRASARDLGGGTFCLRMCGD